MNEQERLPEEVFMEAAEKNQLSLDEVINSALVKHNVTEAKIADLKEKYLPLKIKNLEDKETYLEVKEARKECKALRVAAKKLCTAGREDANAISKAWVAKEKDITGRIGEVEDHLEKQEKEYEAGIAAEKERKKRQQDEQLILRQQTLTGMSALYSDGSFILGDVSFEMSVIRECDNEIWENDIKPKFEEEYKKVEADRLEEIRIKQEREAALKLQEEELKQKQFELAQQEAKLKAAQEEQERKQREEKERQEAAERAAREARNKTRMDQVAALGLIFDHSDKYFKGYDTYIHSLDIDGYSDEKWAELIDKITPYIAEQKEEEEQKRLAEIEAQKEAARKDELRKSRLAIVKQYEYNWANGDIADPSEGSWGALVTDMRTDYEKRQREQWEKEQEEKRKADELKKQQEMEQSKEKKKWEDIIVQVNGIQIYEFKSAKYINKVKALKQLLDQIKAL